MASSLGTSRGHLVTGPTAPAFASRQDKALQLWHMLPQDVTHALNLPALHTCSCVPRTEDTRAWEPGAEVQVAPVTIIPSDLLGEFVFPASVMRLCGNRDPGTQKGDTSAKGQVSLNKKLRLPPVSLGSWFQQASRRRNETPSNHHEEVGLLYKRQGQMHLAHTVATGQLQEHSMPGLNWNGPIQHC